MKTSKYLEELKPSLPTCLVEAKKELFNLRFQNATNQLDNTSRIKEVRKNIARIQTIITEKQQACSRIPERRIAGVVKKETKTRVGIGKDDKMDTITVAIQRIT